jgi:hypothetical protein
LTDVTSAVELDIFPDPVSRYRNEDGDWAAGVRPPNVVETVNDVEWAVAHRDGSQIRLVCCFCGEDHAARTVDEGQRWFRTHPCQGEGVPIEQWLAA